jgi:hypothetical protein
MARESRSYYLMLVDSARSFYSDVRRMVVALATIASGQNPDGSLFLTAVEPVDGDATGVTAATKATGTLTLVVDFPANGETLPPINGVVFTMKDAPSGANDIQRVTTSFTACLQAIADALNASTNPLISVATYGSGAYTIEFEYDEAGVIGNGFTLGANTAHFQRSAPTLTGGAAAVADPVEPLVPISLRFARAGGSVEGGTSINPFGVVLVDGNGNSITFVDDGNGGWAIPVKVIP